MYSPNDTFDLGKVDFVCRLSNGNDYLNAGYRFARCFISRFAFFQHISADVCDRKQKSVAYQTCGFHIY